MLTVTTCPAINPKVAGTRVFYFMGDPHETRHLVMQNEDAVLSPHRSIPCGCGTGQCTFCWAMAGDKLDCSDMDVVAMDGLR